MAILGIGVDHDDLLDDVSRYFDAGRTKPQTPVASLPSNFIGGSDLRQDDGTGTLAAALVASAAPKTAPEAAAFKVLAKILGKYTRMLFDGDYGLSGCYPLSSFAN